LSDIFGFNKDIFPPTNNRTTDFITRSKDMGLIPNISPVNSYIMLCNLAYNPISSQNMNILYSITSNGTQFGSNIYLSLPQYQYVDCAPGSY